MKFTTALKAVALASVFSLSFGAVQAQTLHMMNGGEPASLDPHRVSGDWENRIVGDYIEGLMTEDAEGAPILGAAESYEVSEDGLVYTFKIREDSVWSDGEPVTAGDFVFAFQRLMNPETAAGYAYLQYPIKNAEAVNAGEMELSELGVAAIDDKTLEITLENPAPFFLGALTHYTAYPVPQHAVEEFGDDWIQPENIVGNGPYTPVEWVPGSHIKSVKSESYHDAENVQIEEVMYYALDDLTAAVNRYRAGEFDILTDFPADQVTALGEDAAVAAFQGVHYYVMNQNAEKLQDVNVRKALSMAINREVIGPDLWGTGEVAAYSWVPPGTANYVEDAFQYEWADTPYGERVEEARALMEAAGYSADNPLQLTINYNTNDNHQRLAVAISSMWEQVHVTTELSNAEVAVHYDALQNNDFDSIGRAGWLMDYNDPINMLELLRSDIQYNYGRYSNPEFDQLLRDSATELDLEARAEILAKAETIAMEDYAALPLAFYVSRNAVSPRIEGFVPNARDVHRTRWMSKSE
ncbi:MAG: peptide ABC transporter substrate-binding protein [Devosia marina]|uniref:peptide ABC transporter substrate-binding protein n=1 Tax=Devosia marina TaxID=2683198 RepID=UPI000D5DBDC8